MTVSKQQTLWFKCLCEHWKNINEKALCKFNISVNCGVQIAVGLMIFQQIGGINGVGFYASQTFVAAGKLHNS